MSEKNFSLTQFQRNLLDETNDHFMREVLIGLFDLIRHPSFRNLAIALLVVFVATSQANADDDRHFYINPDKRPGLPALEQQQQVEDMVEFPVEGTLINTTSSNWRVRNALGEVIGALPAGGSAEIIAVLLDDGGSLSTPEAISTIEQLIEEGVVPPDTDAYKIMYGGGVGFVSNGSGLRVSNLQLTPNENLANPTPAPNTSATILQEQPLSSANTPANTFSPNVGPGPWGNEFLGEIFGEPKDDRNVFELMRTQQLAVDDDQGPSIPLEETTEAPINRIPTNSDRLNVPFSNHRYTTGIEGTLRSVGLSEDQLPDGIEGIVLPGGEYLRTGFYTIDTINEMFGNGVFQREFNGVPLIYVVGRFVGIELENVNDRESNFHVLLEVYNTAGQREILQFYGAGNNGVYSMSINNRGQRDGSIRQITTKVDLGPVFDDRGGVVGLRIGGQVLEIGQPVVLGTQDFTEEQVQGRSPQAANALINGGETPRQRLERVFGVGITTSEPAFFKLQAVVLPSD